MLAALPDEQIDTADIPEVRDWTGAKRGLFYRPVSLALRNHMRRHARVRKSG